MNAISDPGRPRGRDRRRTQKLVNTAFAEGRLTAADRDLRTQRIEAAHTRGDLAMITRDLVSPSPTNLGRALDPSKVLTKRPVPSLSGTPTVDLSGVARKVRWFILIAVGVMFASCAIGLLAFVPAVLSAFDDVNVSPAPTQATPKPNAVGSSAPAPDDGPKAEAAGLHTAAGGTRLVQQIEDESGTTDVYDLVVYPQYASVGLDRDNSVERRFYRNGGWQDSVSVRTPKVGSPVDLGKIDADVIARLPAETAEHFGIHQPNGTYVIVNDFGSGPRINVYVQAEGRSEFRSYDLDGTPLR